MVDVTKIRMNNHTRAILDPVDLAALRYFQRLGCGGVEAGGARRKRDESVARKIFASTSALNAEASTFS